MAHTVIVLSLGCIIAMPFKLTRANAPLGISDGALAVCPETPNCVSSQASDAAHRVRPLSFSGSAAEAKVRLKNVINGCPRARLLKETDEYLHYEFATRVMRFKDDVEFYIDNATKTIHVRSASRLGRYDFGVNRRRVESIRDAFVNKTSPSL
jgi:uncharacterized protein (DUF1499 family)